MLLSSRQRQELVSYLLNSQKQQNNRTDSPCTIPETYRGQTVIDEPFTEIRMGDLYFCQEQRLVYIGEQEIKLTAKEFDILALLITHPKRVCETFQSEKDWHISTKSLFIVMKLVRVGELNA